MTGLFDMRIRVGGDPRGFNEFTALCEELAKLGHPACPDVDWVSVEQWCLTLFQHNGADLQTACFYTLARSRRHGLEGMTQGLALIEALVSEGAGVWPPMQSVRVDILGWLCVQLQPLLRSVQTHSHSVPLLVHLGVELERLDQTLMQQASIPVVALQSLRDQVASLIHRLERSRLSSEVMLMPTRVSEPAFVMPVVMLPPPRMTLVKTNRQQVAVWLLAVAIVIALAGWVGWREWVASPGGEAVLADPVRLDSLSLFDAGSAELKAGSTKVLINALVGIKAQPGWLIVIAGHTDGTGAIEHNLQLSHARASAVRDWMQQMGNIADSCFAVQGFAAKQPIASNETEAGRTANRRVDIHLVPQVGACEQAAVGMQSKQSS
jgi:type VI secretion system protein VasL